MFGLTGLPRRLRLVGASPALAVCRNCFRSRLRRSLGRRSTSCALPRGPGRGEGSDSWRREPHPRSGDPKASSSRQTSSVGVVNARQRSPRISSRRYPSRRQSAMHAIRLSMLSTFRRVCATSTSSIRSSTRSGCFDEDLAPELPASRPRVAFENMCLPSRWPMSGKAERKQQERSCRVTPNGCADERKARDPARSVDREGDRQVAPPIELATMSTVGSSSASMMSRRNVRPWSSRSTPR